MRVLNPNSNLEGFFQSMQGATERALVLNYDGTLSPLFWDPAQMMYCPYFAELLDVILEAGDRLVLITERTIADIGSCLGSGRGFEIWGSNGSERRMPDGKVLSPGLTGKGAVIKAILSDMSPQAAVAFLGSDNSDEEGFLAFRGRGLPILVREEVMEGTAADILIQPPDELLWFFHRWCCRLVSS